MKRKYNTELKNLSRGLRSESTPGEVRLWCEILRGRRMYGYQFLRQFPVDRFIVDFVCRKLRLAIEVDGYSHQFKESEDVLKTLALESYGFNVLRFTENQVKKDLPNVYRVIENYIEEFEMKHPPNPPSPKGDKGQYPIDDVGKNELEFNKVANEGRYLKVSRS